ncbi:hypothetical protein HUE56_06165 (plasmid) [Azospirillum oryzae]|uniref:Uncharacterized protein n=1 Tax=Azospirillum oryzae TaxID=286727 RepID=A0A6N1AF16_9PROT|nr:hypothetical protein [Azospirillum oryzae]KAA0588753.1 hypothetical protein FZ938_12895 [Azospirillum oryzae]QKS50100.1 hypothetical protein HUE56_06165 [Azospirillum oryzae]GLR81367.1 hypothetical protein GCM10007856_40520 [Azospirillum oryzae]
MPDTVSLTAAPEMTDEEWAALPDVCEVPQTAERALCSLRNSRHETRNCWALLRTLEVFGELVETEGTVDEVAEMDEMRQWLAEAIAYEDANGPFSILNWDHPTEIWVEQALAFRGKPTRSQELETWRATRGIT